MRPPVRYVADIQFKGSAQADDSAECGGGEPPCLDFSQSLRRDTGFRGNCGEREASAGPGIPENLADATTGFDLCFCEWIPDHGCPFRLPVLLYLPW